MASSCVHIGATLHSTDERAAGVLCVQDWLDVTILHRGETPTHHKLKLSATAEGGKLVLCLRRLYPNGSTAVLYKGESGRDRTRDDEVDWAVVPPAEDKPPRKMRRNMRG